MNIHNINTIARYEVKLLRRSWLFRIFAILALIGITTILLADQTDIFNRLGNIWPKIAISSLMPFTTIYLYNIAQSVIVIFLAGSFLKRDKKLDTAEVIYVRPMSNADYIIGKTWGIVKVFLSLNIIMLLITAFLNLMVNKSPFSIFPYIVYLLTISLPSLIFVLGLSFTVMCLLKNQAVTFIVMLGITGTVFFYTADTLYGVFDFFGVTIPAVFSDVTGHANLWLFLLQRFIYLLAGVGFITFTIALVKRLPHRPWKIIIVKSLGSLFLLAACTTGSLYVLHYNHRLDLRNQYIETFNKYAERDNVDILVHDITIIPQGKSLQGESVIRIVNHYPQILNQIFFYLNPVLQVTLIESSGKKIPFKRENQVILLEKSLAPGQELILHLTYAGHIDETICYTDIPEKEYLDNKIPESIYRFGKRYAWLTPEFTLLTPECLWYPVSLAPVNPAAPYNIKKNFTDFTLTVEYGGNKTLLSQGKEKKEGDKTTFTNTSLLPGISLTIADYEKKNLQVDSVNYEIYYFKGHDFFSPYFTSLRDTLPGVIRSFKEDIEVSKNRDYPFRKFTLAEVPVQFSSSLRNWKGYTEYILPEIVFLPERGATLEIDFKAVQKRSKEWQRQDQGAPDQAEIDINMLRNFVYTLTEETKQIGWNWQKHYVNPYNISPLFFNHSSSIQSDEFPVIDIVIQTMQDASANAKRARWGSIINDNQRANLYLQTHSLQQAVADPEIKPEILYELVKLKSLALYNYITAQIPEEELQHFMKDFSRRFHFQNISFETFAQEIKSRFGPDLSSFIREWYTLKHTPTLLIREVDANQVVIEEQTKYQTRFKINNPSETDAIITASVTEGGGFNGGGRRGGRPFSASALSLNYIIPAGQAREIKLINDNRPAFITINTNISHNLPTSHTYNFSKIENTTQDTSSGIFPIDPAIFKPNPNEIIVDNEDSTFKLISSNNRHKLKDFFRKKEDEKYKNFMFWWPPSQWTAIAADFFYGETINSAVYKSKGSGANSAVWTAEIPRDGYYEVAVWSPHTDARFGVSVMQVGGGHRRHEERNQTYILQYGQEKETIALDMGRENNGWVSLGNYYIPKGQATITLTDKVSGNYVIADAVKFTLAE